MSKFKHYNVFSRGTVSVKLEALLGKVMREQSKSLMVIGGEKRKSNFPEKHWAAITYDDRRALPGYR